MVAASKDVYKRQPFGNAAHLRLQGIGIQVGAVLLQIKPVGIILIPVSYTHLDVYKRQVRGLCGKSAH